MIITISNHIPEQSFIQLKADLEKQGFHITQVYTENNIILCVEGKSMTFDPKKLLRYEWVEKVVMISEPYKLASRKTKEEDTTVIVKNIAIGQQNPIVIIAGPCSVESKQAILQAAAFVKESHAHMLRGGAYKPRTSPYAFQGLQENGLVYLKEAGDEYGLPVVSELMSVEQIPLFEKYVDLIQIGARNMQNFELLKAVGKIKKPILLKRGISATIEEWLLAAEYILANGNPNVILCERGIRTFETTTRNTLDLTVIPIIKEKTHLPIIIDPSHAAGNYKWIESLSLAAIAAGADGLMIETHQNPEQALSDGAQSLKPEKLKSLIEKAKKVAHSIDREIL